MKLLLFLQFILCLFYSANSAFFDHACPSNRDSIGACLVGLCPAGSECIANVCCRKETATEDEDESETISTQFGVCAGGLPAIGECISDTCPDGFICEDSKCCQIDTTGHHVFTTTQQTTNGISDLTTTEELVTTNPDTEGKLEVSNKITVDSEIEDLKREYEKLKEIIEKRRKAMQTTTPAVRITTTNADSDESSTEDTTNHGIEEEETTNTTSNTTPVTDHTTTEGRIQQNTTTVEPSTSKKSSIHTTTTESTTPSTTSEMPTLCPVGEPIGECIANMCPEGHSCFNQNCCILTPEINCTDTLVGCRQHLCDARGYKQFMTRNCPKTCARCHFIISEKVECRDRRHDCAEWASEGFCQSSLYTTRQKMKFCGKSCKLC